MFRQLTSKLDRKEDRKMILQWRGYNNNFTYEEAEQISIATVYVTKADKFSDDENEKLKEMQAISEKIHEEIIQETHCDDILYIGDKPLCELGVVNVAMLDGKNKHCTYVFDVDREVYLLNDSGKTIRRV